MLLFTTILLCGPTSLAQSKSALRRATHRLHTAESTDQIRSILDDLDHQLNTAPREATPQGWWLTGDAAARLAMAATDGSRLELTCDATQRYERAVAKGITGPDLHIIQALADALVETDAPPPAGWKIAIARLDLLQILTHFGATKPLDLARAQVGVVRAALRAGEIRSAYHTYEKLEAAGGFIEPLAIEVSRAIEIAQGPHRAFLFLTKLREAHPNRSKLLIEYTKLCLANGWEAEAREALSTATPQLKDTYQDHMFLAGNLDALGDTEAALTEYRLALKLNPRGFDANWLYATLLQRIADESTDPTEQRTLRDDAIRALQIILESNPENLDTLSTLSYLLDATHQSNAEVEATIKRVREHSAASL